MFFQKNTQKIGNLIANFYICTSKKEVIGIIYFFKYIFTTVPLKWTNRSLN